MWWAPPGQEGKTVPHITERGYGKRTPVEDYRITSRGGLGIRNYMVTDKTGPIVGIKVVDGGEDLLLVTESGILIRTPVQNIRTAGAPPRVSSLCALRPRATGSFPWPWLTRRSRPGRRRNNGHHHAHHCPHPHGSAGKIRRAPAERPGAAAAEGPLCSSRTIEIRMPCGGWRAFPTCG